MTVQRHDRPHPYIERTFTAVRAALPAANVAAFDTELEAITHVPVVDLAALEEFLSGWWRIVFVVGSPRNWCRVGCGRTRCFPSGSGRWRRGSWHRCVTGFERQRRQLLSPLAAGA
jgi:hypothetical protein